MSVSRVVISNPGILPSSETQEQVRLPLPQPESHAPLGTSLSSRMSPRNSQEMEEISPPEDLSTRENVLQRISDQETLREFRSFFSGEESHRPDVEFPELGTLCDRLLVASIETKVEAVKFLIQFTQNVGMSAAKEEDRKPRQRNSTHLTSYLETETVDDKLLVLLVEIGNGLCADLFRARNDPDGQIRNSLSLDPATLNDESKISIAKLLKDEALVFLLGESLLSCISTIEMSYLTLLSFLRPQNPAEIEIWETVAGKKIIDGIICPSLDYKFIFCDSPFQIYMEQMPPDFRIKFNEKALKKALDSLRDLLKRMPENQNIMGDIDVENQITKLFIRQVIAEINERLKNIWGEYLPTFTEEVYAYLSTSNPEQDAWRACKNTEELRSLVIRKMQLERRANKELEDEKKRIVLEEAERNTADLFAYEEELKRKQKKQKGSGKRGIKDGSPKKASDPLPSSFQPRTPDKSGVTKNPPNAEWRPSSAIPRESDGGAFIPAATATKTRRNPFEKIVNKLLATACYRHGGPNTPHTHVSRWEESKGNAHIIRQFTDKDSTGKVLQRYLHMTDEQIALQHARHNTPLIQLLIGPEFLKRYATPDPTREAKDGVYLLRVRLTFPSLNIECCSDMSLGVANNGQVYHCFIHPSDDETIPHSVKQIIAPHSRKAVQETPLFEDASSRITALKNNENEDLPIICCSNKEYKIEIYPADNERVTKATPTFSLGRRRRLVS